MHSEKLTTFENSVVSTLSPVAERVSTSDDSEIRISKPSFPDYKLPLDFQAGVFSHPEWVTTQYYLIFL